MLHGVRTVEQPTAIRAVQLAPSALPFVVGTAPVHTVGGTPSVNAVEKLSSWQDVLDKFGYVHDFKRYTLMEFLYYYFRIAGFAPVLAVNEFDPTAVAGDATFAEVQLASGVGTLRTAGALVVSVAADAEGATTYVEGDDYTLVYTEDGYPKVTRVATGDIPADDSKVYVEAKVISETQAGVDSAAIVTGLGLMDQAFAKFQDVPSLIVAPGYSDATTVAAAMVGKAAAYGGGWEALALCDIDVSSDGADDPSEAAAWKNTNGFTDHNMDLGWGLVRIGADVYHWSTIQAAMLAATDRENADIPFVSGSNRTIVMDGLVNDAGAELLLTDAQANDLLNSHGINTLINHGGWRTWGNYSAAYPDSTDPKDIWRNYRRMLIWLNNSFRLDISQIDGPANYRAIESVVNTRNIELNGLAAQGALIGQATVEFRREDNPLTSMLNGQYTFKVLICPPTPLQSITYEMEIDTSQFDSLFANLGGGA